MSADAWRVCPKCEEQHRLQREAEIATGKERLAAAYGKVSAEEYLKLANETVTQYERPEFEETLREDYSISMVNGGEFFVSYVGRCIKCQFAFRFKHEEKVTW